MSKNAGGYMGIQVGKLGPAVGFMWKGKNVYRSYNPFARDPKTPKQLLVRAYLRVISQTARLLSPAINFGYAYKADSLQTTERGLFIKDNYQFLSGDNPDDAQIAFENLKLSDGPLTMPSFGTAAYTSATQTIDIPFTGNAGIGCALDDDEILVYAVCPELNMVVASSAARNGESPLQIAVPASFQGHDVFVYGFAQTTVEEPTYIETYGGTVYPKMTSPSTFIATLQIPS